MEKELGCLDDDLPVDMGEGVSNTKNKNIENNDELKETECLDDRNNKKNEKYNEEKNEYETTNSDSTTMDEGKEVIK